MFLVKTILYYEQNKLTVCKKNLKLLIKYELMATHRLGIEKNIVKIMFIIYEYEYSHNDLTDYLSLTQLL